MRNFNLNNWEQTEEVDGLLFFALKWQEMLFDFSLDSYKNRVMNLPSICEELISTYDACEMGLISWNAINSIRDELISLLNKNPIAKELIGNQYSELEKILKSWDSNESEKKKISYAASIIKKKLDGTYFDKLKTELINAVYDQKKKYKIKDLSSETLTELIRLGYSRQYIYHRVKSFFFNKKKKIKKPSEIENFIESFDLKTNEYTVVFILPRQCKLLSKGANPDFISNTEKPDYKLKNNRTEKTFHKNFDKKTEGIFELRKIHAKDEAAARKIADDRLQLASTFVGFFSHQLRVVSPDKALIYHVKSDDNKSVNVISKPKKSTLKKTDQGEHTLEKSLVNILGPFVSRNTHQHTKSRLVGALRSHIEGVHATATQNQFSNLWTSLESLAESTSNQSTLKQIEKNCIPILCYKYFLKLIVSLDSDLRRCVKNKYEEIQSLKEKDEKEIHFLVRFLVSENFEEKRSELYSECKKNPLLRFRIYQFHELLSSPKKARKLLNDHEQRLRWHLKRMYIARNLLVHGGLETSNLELLVENLHTYVDRLMLEIVNELRKEVHHVNFDKVYYEYNLKYSVYIESLKNLNPEESKVINAKIIVFDS